MSEAFPALVATTQQATSIDSTSPDVFRVAVSTRPFLGGVVNTQATVGTAPGAKTMTRLFANGAATDMTVNGSSTQQVYAVTPSSTSLMVSGVGLYMYLSNNVVFNGAAFGGRYYSAGVVGVIAAGYYAPGALSKGLLLQVTSGGVTTQIANLTVNEDFIASQIGATGGSLSGNTDVLICRYEMRQPLVTGTSDQIFWTVRDNMTNNQGIQLLRSCVWGQTTP